MTESSSSPTDVEPRRSGLLAWTLLPISLFPLVALLTYDWRAIEALNLPPAASANWIGALGDAFAYHGYRVFGIAIWIVPVLCIVTAVLLVSGRRGHSGRRGFWLFSLLVSTSCLLQVVGTHANPISDIAARLNLGNDAGGIVGYMLMTQLLSPLLSDFGSAVLVSIAAVVSFLALVGFRNIARVLLATIRWAIPHRPVSADTDSTMADDGAEAPADPEPDPVKEQYKALLAAKAAAKEEARLEKERIRAEKLAARAAEQDELLRIAEATRREAASEPASAAEPAAAPRRARPAPPALAAAPEMAADDKGPYILPSVSLLSPIKKSTADHSDVSEMSQKLIDTLKIFGVDAVLAYDVQGPVVTKYALRLAPGIKYSAVTNISDNLMGALHAKSLRIEAPIPGEECVGIEVPNRSPAGISFREIFESKAWREFDGELPLLFGKDAAGNELIADLASMPHMLVAGATGQGTSVCLNSIINGLLMTRTPEQLKLIMVDPKSVEFSAYASIPHLIVPVITENKKVVFSLRWAVAEMDKRLKMFARAKVRNIHDFNNRLQLTQTDMFGDDTDLTSDMPRTVPYIVIIIDEVADLMSTSAKEVVPFISRLTAKARAAGIHLILATQRPDAKVITGTIKANIPGRVAFKTSQAIDSRTILDEAGAENLIGRGDMLFKGKDGRLIRAQGAWISDADIASIVRFIEQHSNVQFDERFTKKLGTIKEEEEDIFADPESDAADAKANAEAQREQVKAEENANDFKKAVECIINTNRASTSHFQRKLGWGYNHSAKIMDMLEEAGIIAPQSGAGPRQIIMDQDQLLAVFNDPSAGGASGGTADAPTDADASISPDDPTNPTEALP